MAHSEQLQTAISLAGEIRELEAVMDQLAHGIRITEIVIAPQQVEYLLSQNPLAREISAAITERRIAIAELSHATA